MEQVSDLPVPRVHFGTKSQPLLSEMLNVGATVMGVDVDTPLDIANEILGGSIPHHAYGCFCNFPPALRVINAMQEQSNCGAEDARDTKERKRS